LEGTINAEHQERPVASLLRPHSGNAQASVVNINTVRDWNSGMRAVQSQAEALEAAVDALIAIAHVNSAEGEVALIALRFIKDLVCS
jgi:hypothetical protein